MTEEQQSLQGRQLPSKKTILLLLVIALLVGVVVIQQIQISYPTPVALQKTPQAWMKFATVLDAYYVGANGPDGEAPSQIVVPLNMDNSTCMSIDHACGGYDYYFAIENVCQNDTYYGTCNFVGYSVYWFDITKNVLLVTGLDNISVPKGQTVTFHGNWANNVFFFDNPSSTSKALAAIGYGDLMFVEISTSGGWWSAATSISSS